MSRLDRIVERFEDPECTCDADFEGDRLVLLADDCSGNLAEDPSCRETAVEALTGRDAERVVVRGRGVERVYGEAATALLVAAGRFADRVAFRDPDLAELARSDPLRAARNATARAGPAADLAARTGLAAVAERAGATGAKASVDYGRIFRASSVPVVARMRLTSRPPPDARLCDVRELETGAVARIYESGQRRYYLQPPESTLDPDALATLAAAHERLADGAGDAHPDRAPERAVRAVASDDEPVLELARILRKHTRGYGVLADFFADPRVSDVYATAPVGETELRAVVDGTELPTNVTLTEDGARALASRLRRESGRAFSRASPTIDATAELPSGRVRVAGVTDPVSDGVAFAFRDHGRETWTIPALVENDTLSAGAGALLSLAVERDAATLIAGARGTGKTTTLGALLWELPATTRALVIEDTPELPVKRLQAEGRDVQSLHTATHGDAPGIEPDEALRTALRLGDSALVVGEVRGEEATVLYEAMRVGASDDAVLGTIHGDGGEGVRERVTSDLNVPVSSFAATDLVATLGTVEAADGEARRLTAVEEVIPTDDGVRFGPLYEFDGHDPVSTGRIERGDSHLIAELAGPREAYADVLEVLSDRLELLADLATAGRTAPRDLREAYARTTGGQP